MNEKDLSTLLRYVASDHFNGRGSTSADEKAVTAILASRYLLMDIPDFSSTNTAVLLKTISRILNLPPGGNKSYNILQTLGKEL